MDKMNITYQYDEQGILLYDEVAFEGMRKAGELAAKTLDYITDFIQPNVTTEKLDQLCHQFIVEHNAVPAPLNYKGYPKSICTSINHVVCHGIPSDRKLLAGDILNIDVTVILDGWYGDTSRMYYAGAPTIKGKRLVEATYEAMMKGIEAVKPGVQLSQVGQAIEKHATSYNFSVVRDFCGHGIGRTFHAPPNVLHYYAPQEEDILLKPGMLFTIEPMINSGDYPTRILADGWTAITKDRSLSAQFEHTIGVTEQGYEIFTLSPKGYTLPPYKAE
jgi:methionyl aminopeptidase